MDVNSNQFQSPIVPQPQNQNSGMATASLVLGLCATVIGCCITYVGIVCGIIAIALAIASKSKTGGRLAGTAIAGLVLGIIGLVLGVAGIVITFVFGTALTEYYKQLM